MGSLLFFSVLLFIYLFQVAITVCLKWTMNAPIDLMYFLASVCVYVGSRGAFRYIDTNFIKIWFFFSISIICVIDFMWKKNLDFGDCGTF